VRLPLLPAAAAVAAADGSFVQGGGQRHRQSPSGTHHAGITREHHGEHAYLADAAADELCILGSIVQHQHDSVLVVQAVAGLLLLDTVATICCHDGTGPLPGR
jgi:hypothetical protein